MSALAILLAATATTTAPAPTCPNTFGGNENRILEHIWQKEMEIYNGRSNGDLTFYSDNMSESFLGWTSGNKEPFRKRRFLEKKKIFSGNNQENIKTYLKGFSLNGNTAVIYYQNHRTKKPDGKVVDQKYDNIHVWVNENCNWKVFASLSRQSEFFDQK